MKKKSIVLVLVSVGLLLFVGSALVEIGISTEVAPEEAWNKTFGGSNDDVGTAVQQTEDGGYIIVGSTNSYGTGNDDVWLIKVDSEGSEEWNSTFGGTRNDWGESVQQTEDGGYIIVGATYSYGSGEGDVWLIKTDAFGNEEWNKTFSGEAGGFQGDRGKSVQQTSDGGYIIVGYMDNAKKWTAYDIWLIKTDAFGYKEWDKIFSGKSFDYGYAVQQTKDGGYIIVGDKWNDIWLIKTDALGNEEWNKTFSRGYTAGGRSVQQTKDGGYIIAGKSWNDVWIIKTDAFGHEVWNKSFGRYWYYDKARIDSGRSVQQTIDRGYIIVGRTTGYKTFVTIIDNTTIIHTYWIEDIYLIKTDAFGNKEWEKFFSGANYSFDWGRSVQQTSDGGYIIVGKTEPRDGKADVWLIKVKGEEKNPVFDTGGGTYPSIFGTHNGTIKPNQTIIVSRLYTYPCAGTGGHSEYAAFYNATTGEEIVNGTWNGYHGAGDYHYIEFSGPFTLEANVTYNYTIKTCSYPQIHHNRTLTVSNGEITCTEFIDANGRRYDDWIPAIRLE